MKKKMVLENIFAKKKKNNLKRLKTDLKILNQGNL